MSDIDEDFGGAFLDSCEHGHVFRWARTSPDQRFPDGHPCICGAMVWDREKQRAVYPHEHVASAFLEWEEK